MPKGMTPLKCDLCGGPLVMDISGEFAACEYCGTKYMRDYLQQKISGAVTIQGNVATRPADFTIRAGVLEKYSGESTDVVIPDNVIKIADRVFERMGIRSVVIPDSVVEIGHGAFGLSELRSVQLSNSLKELGSNVFWGSKLEEIVIPDSVTHIGSGAFSSTQLKELVIPGSVTHIGNNAFARTQLKELVIPDSVDLIDQAAFGDCSSLRKVVLPQNKNLKFGLVHYTHNGEDRNITPFYGCWKLDTIENSEKYDIAYFEGTSMWARRKGLCRHCGNKFNFITKKCTKCGHPKDY